MADYYTLLTNAGIAYETACKAAGAPIKLAQISVGDGNGAVYSPDASAKALKREVWRGPLNALFQDEKNSNWLMAEVTIPSDVGGWYVREAGLWTDTGILYAIVKYPESYKPVLATSGSGKEFYIRSIFYTSNASIVTLLIDDSVVKATRAWVMDYLSEQLAKGTYSKADVEAMIAKASTLPVGSMLAFPVDKIPPGFLELDGSVKSAAAYPDLAKLLAGAFNKGDEGAGNFRLPESRGEFLRGWDHGRGVDPSRSLGSNQRGSLVVADLPSSGQGVTSHAPTASQGAADYGLDSSTIGAWPGVKVVLTADTPPVVPGDATWMVGTSRPRNLAVIWCVKAWSATINQGNIDIAALAAMAAQATEINQGTAKVATAAQMLDSANDLVVVTPKSCVWVLPQVLPQLAISFCPVGWAGWLFNGGPLNIRHLAIACCPSHFPLSSQILCSTPTGLLRATF
jgi:microcystin-dependent protein